MTAIAQPPSGPDMAVLREAGLGPQQIPRWRSVGSAAVMRRGTRILGALGIEPPAGPDAVGGLLAAVVPELADARDAVSMLARAVATRDPELASAAAVPLLGRGPGRTPVGDDLLAGTASAVAAFGHAAGMNDRTRTRWLAAVIAHRDATTPLSGELLARAARGSVLAPLVPLLDLGSAADAGLPDAVTRVRDLGHSSGRTYAFAIGAAAWLLGAPAPMTSQATGGIEC